MGVHTTFVRSVDLDEWTQRQIDAMRLGGNANAKQFFRQHGLNEMHGRIEKKYTSKAAMTYKNELKKQVEAAAVLRGEGSDAAAAAVTTSGNLLEQLALQEKEGASSSSSTVSTSKPVTTAQPKAQLASQMVGAKGKLVVTPPNSGGLSTGMLQMRKPASQTSSAMMFKKKPSGGASSKLRVNKLSSGVTKQPSGGASSTSSDDAFDDIDTVQKAAVQAEKEAKQVADDEKVAHKLSEELNGGGGASAPVVPEVSAPAPPAPAPAAPPKEPEKPKSVMADGMKKLQAMNNDFFSGF
jgi:ADP-ribosylation factor GTPase-activating protein 2/3